jgi:hypothetical protein
LRSGEYLIERSVCEVLVHLWDFMETHGLYPSRRTNPTVKQVVEKMRSGRPLTHNEVDTIIKWRGPLGTICADPDRGVAYTRFIHQWVDMNHYKDHPEVLKKGYKIQCSNCRTFGICHEPEKGKDPKRCLYFEPKPLTPEQ